MSAIRGVDLFHLYAARHGDVAALRGLSLDIGEGDVVAVLGPSGSGKTTLLNLCAGFEAPSSGELTVLDEQIGRASSGARARLRRREIGIVRQHFHRSLPRELSIEEAVALPLRLQGYYGRDERITVDRLIKRAGLGNRREARPQQLSGGEQQRVAVCAALAKRPRLVLADEPTGELDADATAVVVDLLVELVDDIGATAMIVTHDPVVALRSTRTIHIRDGRLAAEGATKPVLIIDEQGWLRLPRRLREQAGFRDRVRAEASWGKVELYAEEPEAQRAAEPVARAAPPERRDQTEITLDRVSKAYGSEHVLHDLSWALSPERLHVVIGPSGSGKTTILNLVAGLDHPDRGEVWVAGERVDSLSSDEAARLRRRLVGYVSQHSTLVDFLTARENVELGLTLRGFDEAESATRATRWLEWVGLAKLADRRADRLSGGESRRVALARALAPQPRVLVADEPTAHLDRLTGRMVIRLLKQVAEEGTTVLAASHDPDVATAADQRLSLTQR